MSLLERLKNGLDLRHQRAQVNQPDALRLENDYRDGKSGEVLLERQISVTSDKYLKLTLGQRQKPAVTDAIPTHVLHGFDIMARKVPALIASPGNHQ